MYCKNCGAQMGERAAFCIRCGAGAGNGGGYCHNCGQQASPGAQVCIHCGCVLHGAHYAYGPEQKSRIAAGVLGILLGLLGIHNFYLGYTSRGLTQLLITVLTCGVGAVAMSIWGLVEGIMILTRSVNVDAAGIPLRD